MARASTTRSRMVLQSQGVGIALLFLTSFQVSAATNTLSGGIQSRYSDNARLSTSDEESDFENRVTLDFSHENIGSSCLTAADVNLGYGVWADSTFDPEVYTRGALQGVCNLTESLQWDASYMVSQQTQNRREADTPENRTRRSVFRTGPAYTFQISSVDRVVLSASYTDTRFEETEQTNQSDSKGVSGTTSYFHNFSSSLEGGLSASVEKTELETDEELYRESVSALFSKQWVATLVTGSIGYNWLEIEAGNREAEIDGVTGSLGLQREINPTMSFSLNAEHQLTDQSSTLGFEFQDFNFNLTDASAAEVTVISAVLNKQFSGGSTFTARGFADRTEFVESDIREEAVGFSMRYARPVAPQTWLTANTAYRYVTFSDDDSAYYRASFSLGLKHLLTQKLSLTSMVGHEQERSDVAAREYDENYISVSLNYQFF